MKREKFKMQEEKILTTSLPERVEQLQQFSKQNYQAPLLEIYSYFAEAGYAASVSPDPEGLGNGYYGGGSGSKGDAPDIDGAYQPYSSPTEELNYVDIDF